MNNSGLKPLGMTVLIKPYKAEKVTKSGIIMPGDITEREEMAETRAEVIEVGPCAWSDESAPRAKPGDKVLFAKYAGKACVGTKDGESYRVVNDRDIYLQIVEEGEQNVG